MLSRIKRLLPVLAAAGAIAVVVCLLLTFRQRQTFPADTGQTRPEAEAALDRLEGIHPASADDADLRRAVEQATRAPHIATVWLFAPDGRLLYAAGSTARSTPVSSAVEQLATDDARRILDALPEDALSGEQRTWMLAVSAMRREGDHNDVYRHLLRPIKSADGVTVALAGVAYSVSDVTPGLGYRVGLLGGLAGLALYWLSLPLWVWLDSRERGERAWAWAAFVLIGNVVALIAYLLTRTATVDSQPSR